MTNLVERHVEEYQQVRGQRGLLDRALIDIGRLVSVSEEARHFTLTVRSVLRDLLPEFHEARAALSLFPQPLNGTRLSSCFSEAVCNA